MIFLPRTYKKKGKQTDPARAGAHNLTPEYIKKQQLSDAEKEDNVLARCLPLLDKAFERRKKGTNWKPEEMEREIGKFFQYCADNNLKPNKAGLQLWLGCVKSQYWEWQKFPEKYGEISNLINLANQIMEMEYINKVEKYPTGNIFLLKAGHNYVEKSEVEVKTNITKPEEIDEVVKKLGLDKAQ